MDRLGELLRFVVSTRYDDLPPDVRLASKRFLLDTAAVTLAGSDAPGVQAVVDQVREWGGREEATIAVWGGRVPAMHAALANAVMAHALDFDDTHDAAQLHANVCVVPAALATAEMRGGVSGRELLEAHVVGLEVACRMALAARPGIHHGWLPTTLFGCFGATAAAGRLLGFTEARHRDAFGIVYSQAAGNRQGLLDGALIKRVQPGLHAKAAVTSALLARRGISGAANVLEGRYGLYPLYVGHEYAPEALTEGLGTRFEMLDVGLKPYPCCRATHEAIDASLELVRQAAVTPEDVAEVVVYVAAQDVAHLVGQPFQLRQSVQVDAQFSLAYTVAAALCRGRIGIADFEEVAVREPTVIELSRKVRVAVDPARAVTVEVRTADGRARSKRVALPPGHPARPLTVDELGDKVRLCAARAARKVPEHQVEALAERISRLETLGDAADLARLLVVEP